MKKQLFFGHIVTLLIGGLIYVAFRTDSLLMFKWFSALSLDNVINELRLTTMKLSPSLPNWFLYSLPDGLWIFSYVALIMTIWRNQINRISIFWILIIPVLAIGSEVGQFYYLVPGTFDFVDLTFYLLGVLAPFIFIPNSITIKTKKT